MSGISTAKALHDAGYQNILILEATSRIGGRIKHERVGNYTVEMGAMWIYGKGSNPVYEMAEKYNISYTDSIIDDWTVRDENGDDVTKAAEVSYSKLQDTLAMTTELIQNVKEDFSVLAGLRNSEWIPKTKIDDVIESYSLDFETGMPPSTLSGKHLHLDDTFEDFGSYDMMAVKHESGFADVVKGLYKTFTNADDPRVLFNTIVKKIEHELDLVIVHTENGELFKADFVVATFSLGVLQHREVKFSPPLPQRKQMAIDMFGMSMFTHIYVQFPYSFWDETMYILLASKIRGHFSCWQNMNNIYEGSNILQLSLFGDDAIWVDRTNDVMVIQEVVRHLQSLYPNTTIPEPSDFKVSRWNTDHFTRGAFSYWPSGFTDEIMEDLQAPTGRIYFAGEHLDPLHYGFVHGAYRSGQQTANSLIHRIEHPGTWQEREQKTQKQSCVSNRAIVFTSGHLRIILSLLLVMAVKYL